MVPQGSSILHIGTYCTYVPWNDGIARKVLAPSHMFLLQVDYQPSFLKYLIHELVSQRHLLVEKCCTLFLLAADTLHFNKSVFVLRRYFI